LATRDTFFSLPAYPTYDVLDPTGAGDAFAGGFLGCLAREGSSPRNLRRALAYATVMGSFAVESFGMERLASVRPEEIEARFAELTKMTRLE
jgi:sugar/nucleoside kinase (ribokinase family)